MASNGRMTGIMANAVMRAALVPVVPFEGPSPTNAEPLEPIDRQRINVAWRTLVDNVVVGYGGGELIFNWRHGGETRIGYAWPEADQ